LRRRLASQPFNTGKDRITLTWSVGVGEATPDDTVDQLLARVDAALYDAKVGGRNRVVGAPAGLLAVDTVAQHGIARATAC
jgi:PleD family two-component response regulator